MFEFASEISLASDENKSYFGIAYDGHQTYLSSADRQISILNDSSSLTSQVNTYRSYHTICYDCILKHFWAASSDRPNVLFHLSKNLDKLESVDLINHTPEPIVIDHLFYDINGEQLYLVVKNQVYTADQTGHLQKLFEIKGDMEKLEGVCAYHNYLLCLFSRKDEKHLSIHTISDGTLLEEYSITAPFKVSSMTIIQDPFNSLSFCLRVLAVKQKNRSFLIDYKPDLEFFTQYSAAYLTDESRDVSLSNIQMQQLCGNRAPNSFFNPGYRGRNNNDQPNPRNSSQNSSSPVPPPGCYSNHCPYCCQNGPRNCHPDCNCCQNYADVIESIALTEASIAHILNAEGEKLQKAIACSQTVSELLRVNESVVKTITHSTHLEQMLFNKLETILNTGCLDCHDLHNCHERKDCHDRCGCLDDCLLPSPCCQELNPQNEISDPPCE